MRRSKIMFIGAVSLLFIVALFYGKSFSSFTSVKANPVVETQWAADNLDNPKVKFIFVDNWPSEKDAFDKGHIPGSKLMGVGAIMGTIGNGSAAPDKAQFEGMMHRLGINNDDHVVLYGAKGDSVFTLGAFWLMDYFGNKNVSYLDGGLAKWNKEDRKVSTENEMPGPSDYKVGSPDESIRIDAAQVLASLNKPEVAIVDARNTDEYTGQNNGENNKRIGHIPGALDLGYYVTNFNAEDGTLKPVADLKAIYEGKGVTKDKEVIVYCQGGIKAANAFFALKHVLGYPNVKNYIGSWGEWGNRVDFDKYPAEK